MLCLRDVPVTFLVYLSISTGKKRQEFRRCIMTERIQRAIMTAGTVAVIVILFLFPATRREVNGEEKKTAPSTVTFGVHCYDVGASALKDMPGVIKVEKGFRFFKEVDTVYYDPSQITVERMEKALKQAGTYRETVP
jgi:hypothetical protein